MSGRRLTKREFDEIKESISDRDYAWSLEELKARFNRSYTTLGLIKKHDTYLDYLEAQQSRYINRQDDSFTSASWGIPQSTIDEPFGLWHRFKGKKVWIDLEMGVVTNVFETDDYCLVELDGNKYFNADHIKKLEVLG